MGCGSSNQHLRTACARVSAGHECPTLSLFSASASNLARRPSTRNYDRLGVVECIFANLLTPPVHNLCRSVRGRYHTVTCLDVMIHYPQDRVDAMIQHLASLSENRLIISFAPYTIGYAVLKRIGELFPGPSKVGTLRQSCSCAEAEDDNGPRAC